MSTTKIARTHVLDDLTPVRAYAALRDGDGPTFLLESVERGERWGRYSILGCRPARRLDVRTGQLSELEEALSQQDIAASDAAGSTSGHAAGASLAVKFARGCVGVFPYDLVHVLAPVPVWPGPDAVIARLLIEPTVVVFDHLAQTVHVAGLADDVAWVEAQLMSAGPLRRIATPDPGAIPNDLDVSLDDEAFMNRVRQAQEHIAAGDIFQVVLARTFSRPAPSTDPLDVYRNLRVLSPSPYMFLFELPGGGAHDALEPLAIAGASPETLVRVEGGTMTLRPIAGTRRRGRTETEDLALADELMADPKELAEHVMLVDLARNDVGRVTKVGSVTVPMRMAIERYSHVMHITSEVRGEVEAGKSGLDVLLAAFPAGTLSGAPKVRALQIIRELETRPRGVYGGAVGYLAPDGDLDLAIAIRTVVLRGRGASMVAEVTAGAGVVEGSDPKLEALETRHKARAALAAIHAASRITS